MTQLGDDTVVMPAEMIEQKQGSWINVEKKGGAYIFTREKVQVS